MATLPTRDCNQMPTVLVVEDEANIRGFVAANLKARGYTVLQASNAEDGLQQLRDYGAEALILDIRLPGMSGWDMLKQIAAAPSLPDIPVIILTASALPTQPGEQIYSNVAAILIKPIGVTELMLAVKEIFG